MRCQQLLRRFKQQLFFTPVKRVSVHDLPHETVVRYVDLMSHAPFSKSTKIVPMPDKTRIDLFRIFHHDLNSP